MPMNPTPTRAPRAEAGLFANIPDPKTRDDGDTYEATDTGALYRNYSSQTWGIIANAAGGGGGRTLFPNGITVTDDDGTAVDGYRALVLIQPPNIDPEVLGVAMKLPGTAYGVGQDYAEGNFFALLNDADNFVAAPVNIIKTISATTNATPVQVTTTAAHGLATGDLVRIAGTGIVALDNLWWKITVTGATTFTLNRSTAPGSTAGAGSVFTDRSPVLSRFSDAGLGIAGSLHIDNGLRGREGGASTATQAIWVTQAADGVGIVIDNADATSWPAPPVSDFLLIRDRRAGVNRFRVNAAGQTLIDAGTQALPSLSFEADPSTGIWFVAGNIAFSVGGVMRLDLNSTGLVFSNGIDIVPGTGAGTKIGTTSGQHLAFWGAAPTIRPTVTGSRSTSAAITSLLGALANIGLITDSSTA